LDQEVNQAFHLSFIIKNGESVKRVNHQALFFQKMQKVSAPAYCTPGSVLVWGSQP
jgi:hypothetical protein